MSPDTSSSTTPPAGGARYLRFGRFCLDTDQRRLLCDDEPVELSSRAFEVLQLFVNSPHRLLTRETIFDTVWKGTIVEDANLTQVVWVLRRALGDDAKSYIRTVAKHGYVFEPPDPIVGDDVPPASPLAIPVPLVAIAAEPPTARRTRGVSSVLRVLFAALAIVAGLVASIVAWRQFATPAAADGVAIIETLGTDANADPRLRDASVLLRDWLQWKLGVLHQIDTNRQGTAPAAGSNDRRVILLSASAVAGGEGWQLDAHVFGSGDTQHFALPSERLDDDDALDVFSRRVAAAIVPDAERDGPLGTTPAATQHYAAAQVAANHGDRSAQVAELRQAQQEAPASGWLRAQLATALGDLGQIRAASAEIDRNAAWIDTLPPRARLLMRARRDALTQNWESATAVYAELVRQHPALTNLRVAYARALYEDQRSAEAVAALDAIDADALPLDQHIEWLRLHASCDYYLVSPQSALATYRRIVELAARSPQLALARAIAEGQVLTIETSLADKPVGPDEIAAFDAIADRIAAAGDPAEAAALRVRATLEAPADQHALLARRVATLLALTRANGDVGRELWALWVLAMAQGSAGDLAAQRTTMFQAEAVAESNGHVAGMRDAAKFLGQDALRSGRYEEAERRFGSVRGVLTAPQIGLGLAALYTAQGRYDDAERAAREARVPRGETPAATGRPLAANVGAECVLGTLLLARGQIDAASTQFGNCAVQTDVRVALQGRIGLAQVMAVSGNAGQAREHAQALLVEAAQLNDARRRAEFTTDIAQVLADIGDYDAAKNALDSVAAFAHLNGLAPLEAQTQSITLQLAVAHGDDDAARNALTAATAVLPASDWRTRSRLDTLRAIVHRNAGDAAAAQRDIDTVVAAARTHGDVVAELTARSVDDRPNDEVRQLVARTGARGATLRALVREGKP